MSKLLAGVASIGLLVALSLPVPASAAQRTDGIRAADQASTTDLSAYYRRRIYRRHIVIRRYYRPHYVYSSPYYYGYPYASYGYSPYYYSAPAISFGFGFGPRWGWGHRGWW